MPVSKVKDINYADIIKGCKNSVPERWMCTQLYDVMETYVDRVRSFQLHQDRCGWHTVTQMLTHVYYGWQCVLCRCANQSWQTLYANKLTDINLQLDISPGSEHSTVHDQLGNRIVCVYGASKPHCLSRSSVYGSLSRAFDILCQSMGSFSETCCYR